MTIAKCDHLRPSRAIHPLGDTLGHVSFSVAAACGCPAFVRPKALSPDVMIWRTKAVGKFVIAPDLVERLFISTEFVGLYPRL